MKKLLLTTLATASLLLAQNENPLVTHTELGYIKTDGNTETETFNLDFKADKSWSAHNVALLVDAQYATNDSIETKNRVTAELNYGYAFAKNFAFDYLIGYKDDKFSGFTYRFYTGPGMKYKALESETQTLDFEANILYAEDKTDSINYTATGDQINYPNPDGLLADPAQRVASTTDSYTSYRLKMVYETQILENLKFLQNASYRSSFEDAKNYVVFSKTALTSKLTDILSAGLSYKIDYTNLAALGKDRTDTTFTFNLIIDY